MEGNSPYITNLVNSIIGVSVLAMPFCLKQCGIILGLGLLFGAAWLTYISCSMLSNSAFYKRRRTYEYLALYTLGPTGKFTVELSMIGMMLGTCIAFYVVIGDLSNGILSRFIDGADPHTLRVFTIIFCALCIALPLAMMKNLSVLSYFGFFSLTFYLAFVVVVILNAVSNGLLSWEWISKVNLWRPAGMFQCLPIFSLAYACQCQLFIVYDSLEEPSVRRIEDIVSSAIKFVTVVYMSVGFFGYTTYQEHIAGNLLVSFPSNMLLDFIKLGFAMSVVLGFPLIIFPCRQSIHTLFFGKPVGEGLQPNTYIPPFLFKSITLTIVLSTMTVAIMIPNVETILGLTGATMGSIICFIFPALIFDKANPKGSGFVAKFVFVVGCLLLVVCTYSNLANTGTAVVVENKTPLVHDEPKLPAIDPRDINNNPVVDKPVETDNKVIEKDEPDDGGGQDKDKAEAVAEVHDDEHRHEPPIPIDPDNPANGNDNVKSPEEDQIDTGGNNPVESEKKLEDQVQVDPVVPKDDLPKQESPKVDSNIQPPEEKLEEERQNPPVLSPVEKQHQEPVEHPNIADHQAVETPKKSEDIPVKREASKDNVEKMNSPVDEAEQQHHEVNQPKSLSKEEEIQKQPPPVPQQPGIAAKIPPSNVKQEVRLPNQEVHVQPQVDQNIQQQQLQQQQQQLQQQQQPGQQNVMQPQAQQGIQEGKEIVKPDSPGKVVDPAQEKELLEKIKIQHDKQQQLLIEQEELIKKLEEHQDKKEQEKKSQSSSTTMKTEEKMHQ
uniref:putative sodium-coupled neutral amino acid transporter 10 isoform X3 n=1 Tax=Styela clava TaxID=7725 RepID=UPI00193935EB|nr:putative sodium-coupled neutral amino acid transporter 10 isoform X3 [Styela clava]